MKVYKYRGIENDVLERDLKTFQNNQFFAPKFEMLNDPFEANFNEIISNTVDTFKNLFSIDAGNLKEQLKEIIDFKHKLGIFSLSKTCYNEQMWAYYASSNKGYCIEYDLEKLKDKTRNLDFSTQLDIVYSNEIPTLGFEDLKNNLIFQKMYGVKKMDWKHEKEVRLIFDRSSIKNHHEYAITGIYFGYQASDWLIETFKELFKNRNITYYKIYVNKFKNQLEGNLIYKSRKESHFDISKYNFEVLKYHNTSQVENYYIHLKDTLKSEGLKEFVFAFREKFCYKPSNLNIFNTADIIDLIGVHPLKGRDYIRYADAFIALTDFSTEDFIFDFPYKDFYYKEQLKKV